MTRQLIVKYKYDSEIFIRREIRQSLISLYIYHLLINVAHRENSIPLQKQRVIRYKPSAFANLPNFHMTTKFTFCRSIDHVIFKQILTSAINIGEYQTASYRPFHVVQETQTATFEEYYPRAPRRNHYEIN